MTHGGQAEQCELVKIKPHPYVIRGKYIEGIETPWWKNKLLTVPQLIECSVVFASNVFIDKCNKAANVWGSPLGPAKFHVLSCGFSNSRWNIYPSPPPWKGCYGGQRGNASSLHSIRMHPLLSFNACTAGCFKAPPSTLLFLSACLKSLMKKMAETLLPKPRIKWIYGLLGLIGGCAPVSSLMKTPPESVLGRMSPFHCP